MSEAIEAALGFGLTPVYGSVPAQRVLSAEQQAIIATGRCVAAGRYSATFNGRRIRIEAGDVIEVGSPFCGVDADEALIVWLVDDAPGLFRPDGDA